MKKVSTSTAQMLSILEDNIKNDRLTKALCVESNTYLCLVDSNDINDKRYWQLPYDSLDDNMKSRLKNKRVGDIIGTVKIVAVFDIWEDIHPDTKQYYKPTNN